MQYKTLLQEIGEIPEFEKEVKWYLDEYSDTDTPPWEKYFKKIYADFDIYLPEELDNQEVKNIIGLGISTTEYYNLKQWDVPRRYLLLFEDDPILNLKEYLINRTVSMIVKYYNYNKDRKTELLEEVIKDRIEDWNSNTYVVQERVVNQLVPLIAEKTNIYSGTVIRIIGDFKDRIDQKIVLNYYSCIAKRNEHFDKDSKDQPEFFNFITEQFTNGGRDLDSKHDFFPQYLGVEPN